MKIVEKLLSVPKENEILEAVRDNIDKNGLFWLERCRRIELKARSTVGKWLQECRSIPIRFFLAGENDWKELVEIMEESRRANSKGEPTLRQARASESTLLTMMILYRYDNPFEYDLVVAHHSRYAHMIKSHKSKGTNGWSVFRKYIYALHHEVFHSYETHILENYGKVIDFILPSTLTKSGNRYNDCVLRGLTNDFPRKFFETWRRFLSKNS